MDCHCLWLPRSNWLDCQNWFYWWHHRPVRLLQLTCSSFWLLTWSSLVLLCPRSVVLYLCCHILLFWPRILLLSLCHGINALGHLWNEVLGRIYLLMYLQSLYIWISKSRLSFFQNFYSIYIIFFKLIYTTLIYIYFSINLMIYYKIIFLY